LRRHLYTRPARVGDGETFLEWSRNNPNNGFDPDVAKYPSTITWVVYDKFGPLAMMPMQCPLMMESIATRPGASKLEIAEAMKELTQQFVTQAHSRGAGEIYFLGTDEGTDSMATNQIFEPLTYKVYRLKIKDLETQ
jgi:hypothetical protein